jgi:hypothetical protein
MSKYIGNIPFGGLQINLAAGVAADTDIAVAGIKLTSTLIAVFEFSTPGTNMAIGNQTANCSITSDGNIQCSASTTGDYVQVFWY